MVETLTGWAQCRSLNGLGLPSMSRAANQRRHRPDLAVVRQAIRGVPKVHDFRAPAGISAGVIWGWCFMNKKVLLTATVMVATLVLSAFLEAPPTAAKVETEAKKEAAKI